MDRENERAVAYLREAVGILQTSLELGRGKQPEFYRVVAAQLRLLLCDTTRRHNRMEDIALAPRAAPGWGLHPLVENRFDASRERLPLADWLAQPLPLGRDQARLTIRRLIRQVCDQDGGAHVDLKEWDAGDLDARREWILGIGEYVLGELEALLAEMGYQKDELR
ncbi:MAG: hypothetical protein HPY59_09825 [Anaerolineae bacterium]|nr:hypothetical protein [Anaerolineae bacterium]